MQKSERSEFIDNYLDQWAGIKTTKQITDDVNAALGTSLSLSRIRDRASIRGVSLRVRKDAVSHTDKENANKQHESCDYARQKKSFAARKESKTFEIPYPSDLMILAAYTQTANTKFRPRYI